MKRELALALACSSVALAPLEARATAGTAFGESSRAAALAGSVAARPGDAGTILLCPGGLADLAEPELVFTGQVQRLELSMARSGEDAEERGRWMGGFGLALGTPLPAPLEALRFGLALHFPAEHALRVSVDERSDMPRSPIYDGRPDRLSALGALAYEILPELRVGAGLVMTPSLNTPTEVTYEAERGKTVEEDVVVRLDRDLEMDVAPFAGVRAAPLDILGVGLVYRHRAVSRAGGNQRTQAGGILADDPIDYYQFWDPTEVVLAAVVGPFEALTLSADLTYSRWSDFRSGFDRSVRPELEDTFNPRLGLEWRSGELALRAGYAFEPSPVPEQTATSNYLAADTHVIGLGGGFDLRKPLRAPLRIDAHVRTRLSGTASATKDPASLPDADASLPGQQIDNLGYPGFETSSSFHQLGVTLTLFVGKERQP